MDATAFLFPGQGSQAVGMLADLASHSPVVTATFEEASAVLRYDLWALCQTGPAETLNRTEVTQPAMLAADIATWRVWREHGGAAPGFLAGHSLGEYAALVVAGSLAFEAAVGLVATRGRLMQEATPEGTGAMAAVLGLDEDRLAELCAELAEDEVVSCANLNAPGQVVIAGHRGAVERVSQAARGAGARRVMALPVSVPSHCRLMKWAATRLETFLAEVEVRSPRIPVLHNADVAAHEDPDEIRAVLVRQLWQPVQWTRTIEKLVRSGTDRFIECGPGGVLTGLTRRIDRGITAVALTDMENIEVTIGAQTDE